jgi:DNA topoisomerase I
MAKNLLIVESPAKARTIKKYVGRDFLVRASVGHIKDLPKKTIGVDVKNGFRPEYVVIEKKEKVLADLKKAAKAVEKVYLAPDPDREGEAIAWHIASEIGNGKKNVFRVLLHEITKKGVQKGLANPVPIDEHKFESQQARRILDRLVGYELSPVLWHKIRRGLSAGRVQSVALRLIVEREREILAFVPQEYWVISADLEGASPPVFTATLSKVDGQKAEVKDQARADAIVADLRAASLRVGSVERKERRRTPPPPYVTAKLQQDASQRFGFGAKRTMRAAQSLYEGVELPEEGAVGLITYMRTDSTRVSDDAIAEARAYIPERYGPEALPAEPRIYKTKKSAQDAHEAIRPTSMAYPPERVAAHLEPDQAKIYTMVWQRFVACQMNPAVYDATGVDVVEPSGKYTLRATGSILKDPGYLAVYGVSVDADDDEPEEGAGKRLPELAEGEALALTGAGARGEQKFTQPPARYTEGTLVKEMEEKGIGRPSTYASILSTIQDRTYVEKIESKLKPTELGLIVNDKLVQHFPVVLDIEFTAQMEEGLDRVEEGTKDWKLLLQQFYKPFHATVVKADKEMEVVKAREVPTEHVCEVCGKPMVRKWGRMGSFLACTGYPECRNTKQLERQDDGTFKVLERPKIDVKCEVCGREMAVKQGRFGEFLACTGYPKDCEATRPMPIGVRCPKCGSEVVKRRSKKGKNFWGCLSWAKTGCDFVLWDKPVPQICPQCNAKFLVQAGRRTSAGLRCVTEGCGFRKAGEEE